MGHNVFNTYVNDITRKVHTYTRSLEGDRQVNRLSFPIAFGEKFARMFFALGLIFLPMGVHFLLDTALFTWAVAILWEAALCAFALFAAFRVCFHRTEAEDKKNLSLLHGLFLLIGHTPILIKDSTHSLPNCVDES